MEINSSRLISLSEQAGIGIDSQLHTRLLYPATRKIDGGSLSRSDLSQEINENENYSQGGNSIRFNFPFFLKIILPVFFFFPFLFAYSSACKYIRSNS